MTDDAEPYCGADEIREGIRPCPVCGALMDIQVRKRAKIDVCQEHGIWLDKGELDEILAVIRSGLGRSRRAATRRARRQGAVGGALFGWWALLFE